jgi:nitrite reductase (NADH) small subunit
MTQTTAAPATWTRICGLGEIPERGGRRARLGELEVALFRTSHGGVLAVEDRCPHRGGKLSEGIVTGHEVVCPLHGWKVNLVTGSAVAPDRGCVRRIPARIEGEQVYVMERPEPAEAESPPIEELTGVHADSRRPKLGRRRAEAGDFSVQDFDRAIPVLAVEPPSPATAEDYRLRISGEAGSVELTLGDLVARYAVRRAATHLTCMMFGFTRAVEWEGVRLAEVLEDLGATDFAHASFYSWETTGTPEGERFFETLPLMYALDPRTLLATGLNGGALPKEHGGPLRLAVPFLQGYKSVKWLTWIKLGEADEVGYKKKHGFIEFPEFYPPGAGSAGSGAPGG